MILSIEDKWLSYVNAVYNDKLDIESAQYIECRRAFYAGFAGMHGMLNILANVPDEFVVQELTNLKEELNNFKQAVIDGKK